MGITKQEAIRRLWKSGNLTYKLHSAQVDMYDRVKNGTDLIWVVACSRGWGKSFALLTIAFETCLKKPNTVVKYAAPTAKDLKSIVMDNYKKIMEDCPKEVADKIKWKVQENKIVFEANGSEIHLAGVEKGNFEKLRGATADLCIIDEAGFCDKLDYIVKSVMWPMIARGKGDVRSKRLIMASTPSKSNDHDFIQYMRDYEFKDKLIRYTIDENPLIQQQAINSGYEDKDKYIDEVIASAYPDGRESTAFKREYLTQILTEEDDAVVPEMSNKELLAKIIRPWEDPPFYDMYVAMDIGYVDLTFVIFAYYDFKSAKLIIKDELVMSGAKQMLTDNLAMEIKAKEMQFADKYTGEAIKPYLRVADNNNPILLNDLNVKHNIAFIPTDKDNLHAAVNNLRMMIKAEKVIIDPKCTRLIAHLKGAIWNKNRNKFANAPDKSHYDGVAACVYLCRNLNLSRNPYPNTEYSPSNYHVNNSDQGKNLTPFESFVKATFSPKLSRRRR